MTKKWPKVSVVISNYNGLKLNLLQESLSSVLKNDYPNLEVIMVDNASIDGSPEVIKKKFGKNPRLKIIQNSVNMYSQGLNLGITNSDGEYVAFFNNDVVVRDGYFQLFINFLEKNKDIALSQGKLRWYYDDKIIDSAGETMDEYGNPITIGAGKDAAGFFNQTGEVLSVSGSCSILRKEVSEKIGIFDPEYGIGYEDLDLALRAWMGGYRVIYYPEVEAFHKRGATDLSDMVRVKVRWHFNKNRIATMLKNYPVGFLVKNLPVTLLIYFWAGLWEIIIKRKVRLGLARFTSILWVIGNLSSILAKGRKVLRKGSKKGSRVIQEYLYKKTLLQSFGSFVKAR